MMQFIYFFASDPNNYYLYGMLKNEMIVCGTGHRPNKLGGYHPSVIVNLSRVAVRAVKEHKPDRIISGMALGWDTALAIAAIKTGAPLTAAVPFIGQESRWPEESRKLYKEILDLCDEKVIVCNGGYSAQKMQIRNEWMVDNSTHVFSMYNGDESGGTYNCLKYASANIGEENIINFWDNYKKLNRI